MRDLLCADVAQAVRVTKKMCWKKPKCCRENAKELLNTSNKWRLKIKDASSGGGRGPGRVPGGLSQRRERKKSIYVRKNTGKLVNQTDLLGVGARERRGLTSRGVQTSVGGVETRIDVKRDFHTQKMGGATGVGPKKSQNNWDANSKKKNRRGVTKEVQIKEDGQISLIREPPQYLLGRHSLENVSKNAEGGGGTYMTATGSKGLSLYSVSGGNEMRWESKFDTARAENLNLVA